eukprot:TRINITY_DN11306_c0_g1_i2.p1 TRINITY_DN11306_c0_g1~~TRINITY_DN11306_c0_g1_i2.p1  ORF type:complete len:176 (+),score=37.33 TRINITY_DN11306_c0_g1_i2:190-717(+)
MVASGDTSSLTSLGRHGQRASYHFYSANDTIPKEDMKTLLDEEDLDDDVCSFINENVGGNYILVKEFYSNYLKGKSLEECLEQLQDRVRDTLSHIKPSDQGLSPYFGCDPFKVDELSSETRISTSEHHEEGKLVYHGILRETGYYEARCNKFAVPLLKKWLVGPPLSEDLERTSC